MVKKSIKTGEPDWDKLWAEVVYRKATANKEYLFAYVRKKFGEDDIVMDGAGQWLGLVEEPIYKMITDNDEDSDTFGQRVPENNTVYYQDGHEEKIPIKRGTRFKYIYEATPENLKRFQKLVSLTPYGDTKFIWSFGNGREVQCRYPDEFWTMTLKQVLDHDLRNQRIGAVKDAD